LSREYSLDSALALTTYNRHTMVDERNARATALGLTVHHGLLHGLVDASTRLAWMEDYSRPDTRERYVVLADTNIFSSTTTFLRLRTTSALLSTDVAVRGGFAIDALVRRDHTPWLFKNTEA